MRLRPMMRDEAAGNKMLIIYCRIDDRGRNDLIAYRPGNERRLSATLQAVSRELDRLGEEARQKRREDATNELRTNNG